MNEDGYTPSVVMEEDNLRHLAAHLGCGISLVEVDRDDEAGVDPYLQISCESHGVYLLEIFPA